MLKTFAAAIFPATVLGRGAGNGTSKEDAYEVELIPDILKLYTYNNDEMGTDEFHGDIWYGVPPET
jgi:hypothetical protein